MTVPISAEIIDIRNYTPSSNDRFLVDTNAWFWLLHSHDTLAPGARNYQLHHYPNFLQATKASGAEIYFTTISLVELYRLVESTGYKFYLYKNELKTNDLSRKDFRYNYPAERDAILNEFDSIVSNMKDWGSHLPRTDHDEIKYIDTITSMLFDGMLELGDQIMLRCMNRTGIKQVITDDGDFATVPDIQVFTANRRITQSN